MTYIRIHTCFVVVCVCVARCILCRVVFCRFVAIFRISQSDVERDWLRYVVFFALPKDWRAGGENKMEFSLADFCRSAVWQFSE